MSIDKPTQDKPFTKNDLFWIVTEHGIKFRANKLSQLMGKIGYSIHKECEWRFNNPKPKDQLLQLKQFVKQNLT